MNRFAMRADGILFQRILTAGYKYPLLNRRDLLRGCCEGCFDFPLRKWWRRILK